MLEEGEKEFQSELREAQDDEDYMEVEIEAYK